MDVKNQFIFKRKKELPKKEILEKICYFTFFVSSL